MNHLQRKTLAALPSTKQDWLCIIGRMPGWIQRSTASNPWRPAVCCIVDRKTDEMLYVGVGQRTDTLAQTATRTIVGAITASFSENIRIVSAVSHKPTPGRPASIEFTHEEVRQKIKPNLDAVGIHSTCAPHLDSITEVMRGMATASGEVARPGIMSTLRGDIFATRRYFAAADAFFRAKSWRFVGNDHVIEVRYPPTADPLWAVIMGNGSGEFGIAVYDSLDVVNHLAAKDVPGPMLHIDHEVFALIFGMPFESTAHEDLDFIEQFSLPIHSYTAYPAMIRVRVRDGKTEHLQPTQEEVHIAVALAQALPEFVSSPVHMAANEGYPKPAEATLLLPEDDLHGSIHLKFPPEGLAFQPPMHGDEGENDDDVDDDFLQNITPEDLMRAMEALLNMSARAKGSTTAGKPKSTKKAAKQPAKKLPKPKK